MSKVFQFNRFNTKIRSQLSGPVPEQEYVDLSKVLGKIVEYSKLHITDRKPFIPEMIELTKSLKFFKELETFQRMESLSFIWKYSSYIFKPRGGMIYYMEEEPSKFYIILHGSAMLMERLENGNYTAVGTLYTGETFGESALSKTSSSMTGVKAINDCHLLAIENKHYKIILKQALVYQHREVLSLLHVFPTVKNRSKPFQFKVCKSFYQQDCRKAKYVFREGDPVEKVFIIKTGQVVFTKTVNFNIMKGRSQSFHASLIKQKHYSEETKITVLGRGEVFGEEEVVERLPTRKYSCLCLEDTIFFVINKEDYLRLIMDGRAVDNLKETINEKINFRKFAEENSRKFTIIKNGLKFIHKPAKVIRKQLSPAKSVYIYSPRANPVIEKSASTVNFSKMGVLPLSLASYLGERSHSYLAPKYKKMCKPVVNRMNKSHSSLTLNSNLIHRPKLEAFTIEPISFNR